MYILQVRDKDGEWVNIPAIKGKDGTDYVLTDADKREIAIMISAEAGVAIVPTKVSELENDAGYITGDDLQDYAKKTELPTVPTNVSAFTNDLNYVTYGQLPDVSAFQTEEQVLALINANMPASGDEVSY